MYHGEKITYKNIPIHAMEDLKALIKRKKHPKEEIYREMEKYEVILSQRQRHSDEQFSPNGISSFSTKRYSFKQMCHTQICLQALDFLECIKYVGYTVNARQLIRDYLNNAYHLSQLNITNLEKRVKRNELLNTNLSSTKSPFSLLTEKNQCSSGKSIRLHLCKYLSAQVDISGSPSAQCGLSSSLPHCCDFTRNSHENICMKACQTCTVKRRFSLPVSEIPEFLMLFTFFDGRHFNFSLSGHEAQNLKRLSPYKKEKSYSRSSYCTVLKKIQSLFPSLSAESSSYDISALYRCDNIFLFRKINMLYHYYRMYSDAPILDRIVLNFKLTYHEVMALKEVIIENIFKDNDFIIAGLKSPYLDFMLPFDIFFQFMILCYNYGKERNLKEDIDECKNAALEIFNTPSYLLKQSPLFFNRDDGNFSIPSNEQRIRKFLKNNPFYNFYYGTPDNFSEQFINDKITGDDFYPDFETIKKALNINTFRC